jgi:hypothetical protein
MFKFSNAAKKMIAVSDDLAALGIFAEFVSPLVDGGLQLQCNLGFIALDDEIWQDCSKEGCGTTAGNNPQELISVSRISQTMTVDVKMTAILGVELLDYGTVSHPNPYEDIVTDVDAIGFVPAVDADETFSIEQSRDVSIVEHNVSSVSDRWNVGEFGGHPMPGLYDAEGQYRAKQGLTSLGVCNEHVPTPKGKICSALHGNMERLAETTSPCASRVTTGLNTKYIHWRPHARRNMVPLDPDRFSINQDAMIRLIGWAGNMTLSNGFLQGSLTA